MARIPNPLVKFADRIAKPDRLNLGAEDQFAKAQKKAAAYAAQAKKAKPLVVGKPLQLKVKAPSQQRVVARGKARSRLS